MRSACSVCPFIRCLVLGAFAGAALLAGPAGARDPHWHAFGPGGGTATSLASDPRDPKVVFAAVSQSLFTSRDGGQTWSGLPVPAPVNVVAIAPGQPSTLYAGGSKISRSGDGGRTWKTVLDEDGLQIRALAVTPGQRPVVFALSQNTLLRSADDGQTWTAPFTSATQAGSLAVDPVTPAVAYVADGSGIFRSSDSGVTWTRVLDLDRAVLVAVAPSSPQTVYAVASLAGPAFAVYRSDDGGQTWSRIRGREDSYDRALVVDPSSPKKLYMAGISGLIGSVDGGRVWTPLRGGLPVDRAGNVPEAYALAITSRQGQTVYAGLGDLGVVRSDNRGARWEIPAQTGLSEAVIGTLAFHPLRPQEVFVSLGGQAARALRSANKGRTWSLLPRSLDFQGLDDMAFDPSDAGLFYAATGNGLWKTENSGNSWRRLLGDGERFGSVATAGPGVLLAAGPCGLNRSRNGGSTWEVVLPCAVDDFLSRGVGKLWVDPEAPDRIYAFLSLFTDTHPADGQVVVSIDRGATWRPLPLSNPDLFEVAPRDSNILYARESGIGGGGLKRSQDGGRTWVVVNEHPISGDDFNFNLAVDVRDPDTIYLGTARRVLRSRDGGRTLEVFDPDFDGGWLFTDRARPGFLFERSSLGGLFQREVE